MVGVFVCLFLFWGVVVWWAGIHSLTDSPKVLIHIHVEIWQTKMGASGTNLNGKQDHTVMVW